MDENMADLKPLCRGNRTDRGWYQDDEGRWVPSVFDRRRIAVAGMQILAEKNGGQLHGPVVASVLRRQSTSPADADLLAQNFSDWMQSTQG